MFNIDKIFVGNVKSTRQCKKVVKMKNITIKIQNANQLVEQIHIVTKDGEPTIIPAQNAVNYELVDDETGRALQHIVTKRQDKDLHLSFEDNGQDADVIIENFYAYKDSALIGLAEEGQYYHYIPDTANLQDYVTKLNNGDIEGQALGGQGFAEPWWVTGGSEVNVFPFLIGLGLLGGAVALVAKDDDSKITKMLKDFAETDKSVTDVANPEIVSENNLSNNNVAYTLPENIDKAIDEDTVSAMNNVQNLAVDISPNYRIVDDALPALDSDDEVVTVVNDTVEKLDDVENASVDVNYTLYHDVVLPVVIDTETPII